MSNLLSGESVKRGHTAITRGILRDSTVDVVSMGSQFYNANYFPHIHFIYGFCEWLKSQKERPLFIGYKEAHEIWWNYTDRKGSGSRNKIVIAATPEKVDREYLHILDGGILHEAFHSMYTHQGKDLNLPLMGEILGRSYSRDVPYEAKPQLLKTFWNILEDSYIERQGIKDFGGAHYMLNKLHLMSWEREKKGRNAKVGGSYWDAKKGASFKAFTLMDHVTWYFRDRVQNYLFGAPLDEYDPSARYIVDVLMKDIVERGQNTQSTYETFELAMEVINVVSNLSELQKKKENQGKGQKKGSKGDGEDKESSEGDGSEDKGTSEGEENQTDPENGEGKGEEGSGTDTEEESEGEGDNGEVTNGDTIGYDSNAEDLQDEDTQGSKESGSGGDSGGEDDTNGGSEGDSKDGEDQKTENDESGEGGSGAQQEAPDKPEDFDDIANQLEKENQVEGGADLKSLIDEKWQDLSATHNLPQTDRPLTREYDEVRYVKDGDLKEFRTMTQRVRKDTVFIRSKMAAYLRGEKKVRRIHRQERGRRLSARNVHEVVYKEKPKPFQTRTTTITENAVVSIVIDESGSMADEVGRSRYMLATFAVSLQQLRIPFEVIGFQSGGNITRDLQNDYNLEPKPEWEDFTRVYSTRFNVFRTFDDPLTDKSLSKLMNTRAQGGTPLLAGYDFAARRLVQRPEPRRLLIVITDGSPSPGGTKYVSNDHINICNNESKLLEKMGVETLFIGYGAGAYKITRFNNHLLVSDLPSFSKEVNAYLMKNLRKKVF